MKLLTVTVPCYNSQDYMEHCIQSLLPGGEKVEIIIIDDGSTDRTGAIADDFARRYPTIVKVIHQENGGHGAGINQGLAHASGVYFKVVDSDDWLSEDFPRFLEVLEGCEAAGGTDLVVTNYFYVHSDGQGDRSIRYANALPEGRLLGWGDTHPFRLHQLLTIHSCTFRTELLRRTAPLPMHVFYEDNLMVYQALPHVKRLQYLDVDLYRYFIGRADQSVQEGAMRKRYSHQIQVTQSCFTTCHLDQVAEPRLRRYLAHELFMMFGISILFTRLNKTAQSDADLEKMWAICQEFDPKWARHFRRYSLLALVSLPGKLGQNLSGAVYHTANKIVRFN